MQDDTFDQERRIFLTSAGLAIGGIAIAALFPFPVMAEDTALPSGMAPFGTATHDSVWNIDSACGHFPPYSHPVPHAQTQAPVLNLAYNYDPLDHLFA